MSIKQRRATLPHSEADVAARTRGPRNKTTIAGALVMTAGAALYLFDQSAARKWHVFMIPAVVIMAIGAVIAVVGVIVNRPDHSDPG